MVLCFPGAYYSMSLLPWLLLLTDGLILLYFHSFALSCLPFCLLWLVCPEPKSALSTLPSHFPWPADSTQPVPCYKKLELGGDAYTAHVWGQYGESERADQRPTEYDARWGTYQQQEASFRLNYFQNRNEKRTLFMVMFLFVYLFIDNYF